MDVYRLRTSQGVLHAPLQQSIHFSIHSSEFTIEVYYWLPRVHMMFVTQICTSIQPRISMCNPVLNVFRGTVFTLKKPVPNTVRTSWSAQRYGLGDEAYGIQTPNIIATLPEYICCSRNGSQLCCQRVDLHVHPVTDETSRLTR
jgi:hypothetical protein